MFCGECGTKNESGGKFCQECGAKFETSETAVSEETTEKIVYVQKPPMDPKKKKTLIIVVLLIALLGGGYYYGTTMFTPEKVAVSFLEAITANDEDKLFELYGLKESKFVTKEKFEDMFGEEDLEEMTYTITDVKVNGEKATVEIDAEFDDEEETIELELKVAGKKYLLFPNWIIDNDELSVTVNDYEMNVVEGSKVKVDGILLEHDYLSETKDGTDIYIIPVILTSEYDLEIETPLGITITDEMYPNSYDGYEMSKIDVDDMDDNKVTDIENKTVEILTSLYNDIISGKSYDDIKGNYNYDEFEDDYEDLKDSLEGTYTLTKISIEEPELEYVVLEDGLLKVSVSIDYDYELEYLNYNDESQTISKSKSGITQTIYLDYVDSEYKFAGIYDITDYFSRY